MRLQILYVRALLISHTDTCISHTEHGWPVSEIRSMVSDDVTSSGTRFRMRNEKLLILKKANVWYS